MHFLLQDEPEKGRRWMLLLIGGVVGVTVWGGGLYAASTLTPEREPRARPIRVRMIKAPPSVAPPTAAPEAPKTMAPPTAAPATQAPATVAPKPVKPPKKRKVRRKKKRRKKQVAQKTPAPKTPEPAKPQTPTTAPPSPAPVQLGMTFDSTSAKGRGPAVQVGNHLGGYDAGRAKAPVRGRAPGGTQLIPGRPDAVHEAARVRTKVRPK
jgi:type IV secretory pathway VirB10-like protein